MVLAYGCVRIDVDVATAFVGNTSCHHIIYYLSVLASISLSLAIILINDLVVLANVSLLLVKVLIY